MSRSGQLVSRISALPLLVKKVIVVSGDIILIPLALWLAVSLRYGKPFTDIEPAALLYAGVTFFSIPVFVKLGLYRAVMRYVGLKALEQIGIGVLISSGILLGLMLMQHEQTIPRSSFIIYGFVLLVFIGGSRFLARRVLSLGSEGAGDAIAVYGAGDSGAQLVQLLRRSQEARPVVFLDDSRYLQGRDIYGLQVLDPLAEDLEARLKKLGVERVLLSIPSATRSQRRRIIERLEMLPFHIMTVPGIDDILSGRARLDEIREVAIEDLLIREAVPPQNDLLDRCIRGKTVLVTGAGGSIGSELCRQVLAQGPRRLILLELSEYALYRIDQELKSQWSEDPVELIPLLGSVADGERVTEIFNAFSIDTVYHAAAYKHVPLVEHNPVAGIRNNVFGTLEVARHAMASGVSHFVLVSTDKAVRPTNIMGASKRLAEMVLQALQVNYPESMLSMVRFGNVLDSSGSVVPLFRQQIADGGPVTVTHPEITRFFMTIPEAVQLIIQAGAMAQGGDVYVLHMGEPVKIYDMARRMIRLSGLEVRDEENPQGDIEITFTGLRPGEKLYEELLIGEGAESTENTKIMRAREEFLSWPDLEAELSQLESCLSKRDLPAVRDQLVRLVSGYSAHDRIEDHVWQASNVSTSSEAGPEGGQVVKLYP